MQKAAARWTALLTFCIVSALVGAGILDLCQGHLIYTLDDPYIHLALAQRIALGTYGINLGETTSPSSSILWPFLILPAVGFGWFQYTPLILNLILGGITAFFIGSILDHLPWSGSDRFRTLKQILLAIILVFVGNLTGLVYVGMEHSLQVLIALVAAHAFIEAGAGRIIPLWCLAIVALGPSVRYEMFGIVGGMVIALFGQRRWFAALLLGLASTIIPVCFSLYLWHNNLYLLPNSVVSKLGDIDLNSCGFLTVLQHFSPRSLLIFLITPSRQSELILLLFLICFAWKAKGFQFWTLLGATFAVTAHFFVGHFGWFNRYEIFTLLFGSMILCAALVPLRGAWHWLLIVFLASMAYPFFRDTWRIPLASQNIYLQQYQMHRFASDYYQKSFAVNDLGWASFQTNPSIYVLDLYGLASKEVLNQPYRDAALLDRLTKIHQVGLVMIYPDWFKSIPPGWVPLGRLVFDSDRLTAAAASVTFYATETGDRDQLIRQLKAFSATLPPPAYFRFAPSEN